MSTFSLHQSGGEVVVRLTPWDRRALGIQTAEITSLWADDSDDGNRLVLAAEEWCSAQAVRYLFGRINADDRMCRSLLLARGYQFVETSLTVSRSGFSDLPVVPEGMAPLLRPATSADIAALRMIAAKDFSHGRFLEDPAIDRTSAAERTANWIEDLVYEGLAYTAEVRGQIIGFHAERIHVESSSAELLLTGTASRYAVLALPLWITALQSLRAREVRQCTTLISAANAGVMNLYARLGFQFNTTLLGFRKFL